MTVKIGHAAIDENGKIAGGVAGDQTGREVFVQDWYSKPWTCVLRPINTKIADRIAVAMEQACANDNVGYDQNQRTTLFAQAQVNGWDISKIAVPCECDCSSLVAVCCNAAGIPVNKEMYTGNEKACLVGTGKFTAFTTQNYVADYKMLRRGDVLLGAGHTAIVLTTYNAVPVPVAVSATVSGDHMVGDVLTARDFTIKVTMSDGTVKVNPENWGAYPLALNAESNKITVSYRGVECVITVKAKYRTHKVVKGDTLYKIAQNYLGDGQRYKEIVSLNKLKSTVIDIGQVLKIPNK